jgi:putative acetyltransferase
MMIEILRADPRDAAYLRLLKMSDDYAASLYPAESNHMLDVETLLLPQMHFYGVLVDGAVMGCGGFWEHEDYVEIKRVFIDPTARGLGLSKKLMAHLENVSLNLGHKIARLETGIAQPEALALYASLGYYLREPFGGYKLDPLSVFMEKNLIQFTIAEALTPLRS